MRHRRFGKRTSKYAGMTSIQHSPASIGNVVPTNDQLVTFIAVAGSVAGSGMGANRQDVDRLTEVSSASYVGKTTINVGFFPGIATKGYIEFLVFKAQRQFTTPVVGTNPIPSDAEVIAVGLQQEYRKNMPGWVIQYGQIPLTTDTVHVRTIKIDWAKFKMDKVRDGDFFGITYFNRTDQSINIDWQARYHSRQ